MNSLSWVEISSASIQHNISQIKRILGPGYRVGAVIKSNAYGHGSIAVAGYLEKQKLADYLAVANDLEALALRDAGIKLPIIVLSYWSPQNIPKIIAAGSIELGIYNEEQLTVLKRIKNTGKPLGVHLKIDTGMSRLGIKPKEADRFYQQISLLGGVRLSGIFSHLAASDGDGPFTGQQTSIFNQTIKKFTETEPQLLVHIANSAGLTITPRVPGNLLRLRIMMYGLSPSALTIKRLKKLDHQFSLKPVLNWKTRIIQVKMAQKGNYVSYGLTHRLTRNSRLAILPVGYADGYSRKLSNCGQVLIGGKVCPVRGRVCMNLITVELPRLSKARVGDEAVLIGQQCEQHISADDLAAKIDTINYEVVTAINPEIPRVLN